MKIHAGAGDKYWPGFTNVDLCGEQDVTADVKAMPFENAQAQEIHAIHIFEHLHRNEVGAVLSDWFRILAPGGKLCMEMPSLDKIVQMIVAGEQNLRMTLLGLYGDPADSRPYMLHKWGWGQKELYDVLHKVGFVGILFPEPFFHFPRRDLRVEALKPLSTT